MSFGAASSLMMSRSSAKWRATRLRCDCFGYWFPHRRGGGACEHSSRRTFYEMLRAGVPEAEAMAELSAADLERLYPLPPAAAPASSEKDDADIPF